MDYINYLSFCGGLNFIVGLTSSIFVLHSNRKHIKNVTFSLTALFMSIWGLFFLIAFSTYDESTSRIFTILANVSAIGTVACLFHHVKASLEDTSSFLIKFIYFISAFLATLILIFPNYFIPSMSPKMSFLYYPNPGILYYIFSLFFAFTVFASLLNLYFSFKKTNSIESSVFFYTLLLSFLGGATSFPLVYNIPIYPFGIFLPVLTLIFFGIACLKFDILQITKMSFNSIVDTVSTHNRLLKDLDTAYQIQKRILPTYLPRIAHYDFSAFFSPARQVSGDYYDFFIFSETKIGIVIADIVGKGIPAAFLTLELKNILSRFISADSSPSEIFNELNQQIYTNHIIDKYVPIIYGILDTSINTFTYSNAGHEPGAHIMQQKFKFLVRGGMPLGLDPDERYEEETVHLNIGDTILLFTDGVSDGQDDFGLSFGTDRIETIFKTHTPDMPHCVSYLKDNWTAYVSKKFPQKDDTTIVGFKYEPLSYW